MSENVCAVCNASGDEPCVTKTGAKAKSNHKGRGELVATSVGTISEGNVHSAPVKKSVAKFASFGGRETAKQRFDRVRDQGRAERAAERVRKSKLQRINGVYADPDKFRPLQNRTDRRAMGRTKTAGRGRKHRAMMAVVNAPARQLVSASS